MMKKTYDKVKFLLETIPITRGNDHILYHEYISTFHYEHTFEEAFLNNRYLKIPPYHSVARARREIQRKYPDLRPDEQTKEARLIEETMYYNHYRRDKR